MENEVRYNRQECRFELDLEGGRTAYVEYEEAGEGVLANLGEGVCHRLAAIEARKAFALPNERQAEVDAWLDKKYPERKSTEGEIDYPSLDVPRAK